MDRQPTLRGELIELRPLRPEDWMELFAAASDPLVWELHPQSDRYQEAVFRKFFEDALAAGGALAVIDRKTGKIIGSSRYFWNGPGETALEIGWTFLARAYWGGTYNGEMKRLMLDHAFQSVDQVIFVVGETNFRSRRALEKIGARLTEGRVERAPDHVVYEIVR